MPSSDNKIPNTKSEERILRPRKNKPENTDNEQKVKQEEPATIFNDEDFNSHKNDSSESSNDTTPIVSESTAENTPVNTNENASENVSNQNENQSSQRATRSSKLKTLHSI